MSKQLETKIRDALKDVKPWQRVPTSVNGVYLVKTPADASRETIMVEINPLNERGAPMKRRGLFLKDTLEFGGFKDIFLNESVMHLLNAVEDIDGRTKKKEIHALEI
ncbi:hypothetical protein [Methanobacterium sp. ACI-7]|uniref:hypothetical protein n=1 Tax=unclassified Methanobacterium TaxID=2627676 RepID=UPI0039C04839